MSSSHFPGIPPTNTAYSRAVSHRRPAPRIQRGGAAFVQGLDGSRPFRNYPELSGQVRSRPCFYMACLVCLALALLPGCAAGTQVTPGRIDLARTIDTSAGGDRSKVETIIRVNAPDTQPAGVR